MTDLAKANKLLDQASALNTTLENSYIALGLTLLEIEETGAYREAGHDDFASYYRNELGREKSTVSRLMSVAKWIRENGLPLGQLEGASYKKLDLAIRLYGNKSPVEIVEASKVSTLADLRGNASEAISGDCSHTTDGRSYLKCSDCGRYYLP